MYDARTNLSADVAAEARRHLGDLVYQTDRAPIGAALRGAEPRPADPALLAGIDREPWPTRRSQASCDSATDAALRQQADIREAGDGVVTDRPERPDRHDRAIARSARAALAAGLGALIPQRGGGHASAVEIAISRISPNPYQPRKRFNAEDLASLRASIAAHGVLQPILVSETATGYQLVAGERRLRAAQAAGLDRIPAVIRQLVDRDTLELALVENLQRADLDAIETADAYRQLINRFGFSQDDVATRVGQGTVHGRQHAPPARPGARGPVGSRRRPPDGGPRPGAGRAAHRAPVPRPRLGRSARTCPSARPRSWYVGFASPSPRRKRTGRGRPTRISSASRRSCAVALGTKVSLARSRRGGRIVIEYYSDEDLNRLYERLTGGPA